MATIEKFEDLEVWKLARIIYRKISKIAERLKSKHDYRFAEQIKASAGSIMDNVAEGFERSSRLEFLNSLSISKGECGELKSQSYRLLDDHYLDETEFKDLQKDIDSETRKLASFILYLNKSNIKGLKFKNRR